MVVMEDATNVVADWVEIKAIAIGGKRSRENKKKNGQPRCWSVVGMRSRSSTYPAPSVTAGVREETSQIEVSSTRGG